MIMSTQENKALIRRFYEDVFNKKNLATVDEFYSPNHIDHTLLAGLSVGPEDTKQAIKIMLTAFPDLHVTIEDMIAEGDKVVTRFTTHGTQQGSLGGIPPTGKPVAVSTIEVTRIVDGKIIEDWGLDDRLGMLQQLGMIPVLFGFIFLAGFAIGVGLLMFLRKVRTKVPSGGLVAQHCLQLRHCQKTKGDDLLLP